MRTRFPPLATALVAVCACTLAEAAMYRWVDENGVTVYSQSPPSSGNAVTLKEPAAPTSETTKAAREQLRSERERAFDEDEDRRTAEAEKAKAAKEAEERAASCAAARENLERFENLGPRMIRTADGKVLRLSEDEVQTQVAKARKQVEAFCK